MTKIKNILKLFAFILTVTLSYTSISLADSVYDNSYDYSLINNHKRKYSIVLTGDRHMSSMSTSDWALSGLELYRKLDDSIAEKYNDNRALKVLLTLSRF